MAEISTHYFSLINATIRYNLSVPRKVSTPPDKLVLADTVLVVKYLSFCQTMKTKRALSRGFAQGKDNHLSVEHVPSVDLQAEMLRNKLTVLLVIKGIIHMLWAVAVGALAVEFCGWPPVTDPTQSSSAG
jgi:hypothetical protein